jgi:hypothetical protein
MKYPGLNAVANNTDDKKPKIILSPTEFEFFGAGEPENE